ncbi:MAG: DHH family phosphoesterase [Oscillospiraceae bacterium]|nr:DHH family phosphoesterase [Oscillospiraceae bacterium]
MNLKKRITSEILLCFLVLCYSIMASIMAFINLYLAAIAVSLAVFTAVLLIVRSARIRSRIAKIISGGTGGIGTEQKSVLRTMNLPVLMTDSTGNVLWYNDDFKNLILSGKDIFLEDIRLSIADFEASMAATAEGKEYVINNRHYTVYAGMAENGSDTIYISYFVDDTVKTHDALEYHRTRPSILVIYLDNYDEIENELKGSDSAVILADVNRVLENFINRTNGILTRVTTKQYIAIVEEQHMEQLIDGRFSILDDMRGISAGTIPITLSIGIGRGAKTLFENHIMARQALDMALGRGGDQAALKTKNGYEFYGGASREIEKRNKVKSRIIASALTELFHEHENVVVMGHKISDLDSLGSAIGIAAAARIAGATVNVVVDPKTTMAALMYEHFLREGSQQLFITPAEAGEHIRRQTLIVVVDCHTPAQLDIPTLLDKSPNIVVIDHHRRMVGYIENAVLFYHEPYASSCCEMVAELMQHIETSERSPTKLEANVMLAGIMLDTKNFSVRTGVRTFEAASYLRKRGADPAAAKAYFAISLEEYLQKAELVSRAHEYRGCAIVITDTLPESMRVVVPQTADDLLNIEGISASIVAVKASNRYNVSARSFGIYNVQLIMERMGGGGHQTMAGVQIDNVDSVLIKEMIYNAVDNYLEQNEQRK